MEEKDFRKFMIPVLMAIFAILSFFILKPLAVPVSFGLIFAYIFFPLYKKINQKIQSRNISASIIVVANLLIVLIPTAIFTPVFIRQLFSFYLSMKNVDYASILFKIAPDLASSQPIATEIIAASSHFNSQISGWILSLFQNTLINLPAIAFGAVILMFTFFFALKEGANLKDYLTVLLPMSKEHQKIFSMRFEEVTDSTLYGQVVIGILQGVISGIGYFMFDIPNVMILTVVTMLVGVIPVIGPWLVWIPLDLFLFINGNNVAAVQLLIYGLLVINWVDIILSPVIVARRAKLNAALALIGAIGGVYAFGIIGFVLGPLILAYLILLIEIYRDKIGGSIVVTDQESLALESKS